MAVKLIFSGNTNMLNIPEKFIKELMSKPETGMGYQIVKIILKDGREFNQVAVIQSSIIGQIRGMDKIPFKEDEIDQIILTHDKWDFSKE
jgi:hypothetical protein